VLQDKDSSQNRNFLFKCARYFYPGNDSNKSITITGKLSAFKSELNKRFAITFCALSAFGKLQTRRIEGLIDNLYQVSRQLFIPVIRQFILKNRSEPSSDLQLT